jgi:hypothetical protein
MPDLVGGQWHAAATRRMQPCSHIRRMHPVCMVVGTPGSWLVPLCQITVGGSKVAWVGLVRHSGLFLGPCVLGSSLRAYGSRAQQNGHLLRAQQQWHCAPSQQ